MAIITISEEAYQAIRSKANHEFRDTTIQIHPDGSRDIPLEEDTLLSLNRVRFEGETMSDVLIRLAAGKLRQ